MQDADGRLYSLDKTLEQSQAPITELFRRAGADEQSARELFEMLKRHFRGSVQRHKRLVGVGDSLPTDDPIDWTFAKMLRDDPEKWANRRHIVAAATEAMHNLVRNHRRGKLAIKRGGHNVTIALSDEVLSNKQHASDEPDVLNGDVLDELDKRFPRAKDILLHKHYGRCSFADIADLLDDENLSTAVDVRRVYHQAFAWVTREIDHA